MTAIDYLLATLWLALTIKNVAALLPLFVLLADCLLWEYFSGFARCCLTASIYFASSTIYFVPDKLRYPLLTAGSMYWVGALDELIYTVTNITTAYYDVMPYLVLSVNAYIAMVIFMDEGRGIGRVTRRFVGFANSVLTRL